jgi:hypothetical protein
MTGYAPPLWMDLCKTDPTVVVTVFGTEFLTVRLTTPFKY